jgi:hypothetical protein
VRANIWTPPSTTERTDVVSEQKERDRRDGVPAGAAVCGLYCEACALYIGTHEDPAMLSFLAARLGQTEDETRCDGCRAERRSKYCQSCTLFTCAAGRGHDFCVECSDFPCDDLKAFQCERPHRADLFADLERIAAVGPWEWVEEASKRYACPDCGTMNSAYHVKCRSCGRDPSNAFVAEHAHKIAGI